MRFLKSIDEKYKVVAFEDEEAGEEQDDEPQEDDIFISSTGHLGGKTSLSAGGKHIGDFVESDDVEKAIVTWVNKNKWYPNIWQVSDHGNHHLYTLEPEFAKMIKV